MIGVGRAQGYLTESEIGDLVKEALAQADLSGKRVLVIIPDSTRTSPTPLFFRLFYRELWGRVSALDYLVASGTHQPLGENALNRLVGVTAEERRTTFAGVSLFNHCWDQPGTLTSLGVISAAEMAQFSRPVGRRLGGDATTGSSSTMSS